VTLVSISGACSRAGKTAAAVSVLSALPKGRAAAVKFTTTEDVFERCPRGTACIVCDIDVPFRIVEDAAILDEAGTDTARLGAAGAVRVVWAIARPSAVRAAWSAVQARVAGAPVVVMEGSTIVDLASPDWHVFVVHPHLSPERWKPVSARRLAEADLVVVNRPAADARPPSTAVLAALRQHRSAEDLIVADVARPLGEWAPALARDLARGFADAEVTA
jgi:hypothetical protein